MDTVALAAAPGATTSIGLFPHVLLAPVWPPVLLAKETADIDAVSGGRLTLGLGVGIRPDDFVVDGLGSSGRGRRFDRDLAVYRDVWQGKPVGGGPNPAVTPGARQIPCQRPGLHQHLRCGGSPLHHRQHGCRAGLSEPAAPAA